MSAGRTTRAQRRPIPRTEERVLPAARRAGDRMLAEHLARYRFAAGQVRGRVLDLGCGTGYGARALAAAPDVREVVALDRSPEALDWALRYYPHPKVRLHAADVEIPRWEDGLGSFDAVIAFELIEHLASEERFWRGIGHALAGGGVLWISTPLGRGRGIPASDPFHVHQLRRSEVADLFRTGWEPALFGQIGQWIEPWVAGNRYRTILARARTRKAEEGR